MSPLMIVPASASTMSLMTGGTTDQRSSSGDSFAKMLSGAPGATGDPSARATGDLSARAAAGSHTSDSQTSDKQRSDTQTSEARRSDTQRSDTQSSDTQSSDTQSSDTQGSDASATGSPAAGNKSKSGRGTSKQESTTDAQAAGALNAAVVPPLTPAAVAAKAGLPATGTVGAQGPAAAAIPGSLTPDTATASMPAALTDTGAATAAPTLPGAPGSQQAAAPADLANPLATLQASLAASHGSADGQPAGQDRGTSTAPARSVAARPGATATHNPFSVLAGTTLGGTIPAGTVQAGSPATAAQSVLPPPQQPVVGMVGAPGAPAGEFAPRDYPVITQPLSGQLAGPVLGLRASGDGVHQLTISLHPAELGPVNLHVRIIGDTMSIQLASSSEGTHDALRDALPQLRQELQSAGLSGLDVSLDLNAGSSTGSGGSGTRSDQSGAGEASRSNRPDAVVATTQPRSGISRITGTGNAGLDRWL